jgi:CheY-like chemotaxis protein
MTFPKYIAYVEDDPDDQRAARDIFDATQGYLLRIFESGSALFNFLDPLKGDKLPSLIVLDVNLSAQSGWDILETLQKTISTTLPQRLCFLLQTPSIENAG